MVVILLKPVYKKNPLLDFLFSFPEIGFRFTERIISFSATGKPSIDIFSLTMTSNPANAMRTNSNK